MTPVPHNPSEWAQYANSTDLSGIPKMTSSVKDVDTTTQHTVYADLSSVLQNSRSACISIYSDVIALPSSKFQIPVVDGGALCLYARVLTSDSPTTLVFTKDSSAMFTCYLYASRSDQQLSYQVGGDEVQSVDLDSHLGWQLDLEGGEATVTPLDTYTQADLMEGTDLAELLSTQLRIANIMFWKNPEIATALASHVSSVTSSSTVAISLALQSSALLRQLISMSAAGPNSFYVPALKAKEYQSTLQSNISTALLFEAQYNRFVDREAAVDDLKKAWQTMLNQKQNTIDMQTAAVTSAYNTWTNANDVLGTALSQFSQDQDSLARAAVAFRSGIADWQTRETFKAVFALFGDIVNFAAAIGMMAYSGSGSGAGSAGSSAQKAISDIQTIVADQQITADMLQTIVTICQEMDSVTDLLTSTYLDTYTTLLSVQNIDAESGSGMNAPANTAGTGVPNEIIAESQWHQWRLQTDQQMEIPVSIRPVVGGASEYRLALRKHADNGKVVVQARAQAIKAGQTYIQQKLALCAMYRDFGSLQDLLKEYQGEVDKYEVAKAKWFDRMLGWKTSVLIDLRNVLWSYRYDSLRTSSVTFDATKSIGDYQSDLSTILNEADSWKETYSSDPSPYDFKSISSSSLPQEYSSAFILSLKSSPDYTGTFTLRPQDQPIAGSFLKGCHVRSQGIQPILVGIKPKPSSLDTSGTAEVSLTITTTGLYADVGDDGHVFSFTFGKGLNRPFVYKVDKDGNWVDTEVKGLFDQDDHTNPTPFGQWSVKIENPADLDLSGLSEVTMEWKGTLYPLNTRSWTNSVA